MGAISSSQISKWVTESVNNESWQNLTDICNEVLFDKLSNKSDTEISDLVEEHLEDVEEILRNNLAQTKEDGELQLFEIDDETPPFIRATENSVHGLLTQLCKMDPLDFEKVCTLILKALGAESEKTGGSHDGGVDFLGYNFSPAHHGISVPITSRAIVIGQAKRYKRSNTISETELRKFIGGAIKKADDLRTRSDFGVLSPVLYAFWTTSDFDKNAKDFARKMGLWFMNGPTLASHINELEILEEVQELINKG